MRRRGVWWEAMLVEEGCVLADADGELDDRRVAGRAPSTRGRLPALLCHSPCRPTRAAQRACWHALLPPSPARPPRPHFLSKQRRKADGRRHSSSPAGWD